MTSRAADKRRERRAYESEAEFADTLRTHPPAFSGSQLEQVNFGGEAGTAAAGWWTGREKEEEEEK